MHPQTHLAASWLVGVALPERRDRRLVAWAGVLPDIDGASLLWGVEAYGRWHHVLAHNLLAGVVAGTAVAAVARDRVKTAVLALVAFHLHLAFDLVGSGVGWTVSYLYPLSGGVFGVTWGWELRSWQNLVATLLFFGLSLGTAVAKRRSFVESFMPGVVDGAFCDLVARTWARLRSPRAPT